MEMLLGAGWTTGSYPIPRNPNAENLSFSRCMHFDLTQPKEVEQLLNSSCPPGPKQVLGVRRGIGCVLGAFNSQPYTLNPKPQTLNREPRRARLFPAGVGKRWEAK